MKLLLLFSKKFSTKNEASWSIRKQTHRERQFLRVENVNKLQVEDLIFEYTRLHGDKIRILHEISYSFGKNAQNYFVSKMIPRHSFLFDYQLNLL